MHPIARFAAAALLAAGLAGSIGCAGSLERHSITRGWEPDAPRILCIVAHPDDEIAFAGTLFKASTFLHAACDVVLITNGEGGYKYSTLAERLYGLDLTDPAVGRRELPGIRKQEMKAGCAILGVRDLYWLNQRDDGYSKDAAHVLDPRTTPWDLDHVRASLDEILREGRYDFVFTHLPTTETHGHHQSATILALEAVERMPPPSRPLIFAERGVRSTARPPAPAATDPANPAATGPQPPANPPPAPPVTPPAAPPPAPYDGLPGYPLTRPLPGVEPFVFDRGAKFGWQDKLNYAIVVNWAITAHKSQGTMQLLSGDAGLETYVPYAIDDPARLEHAREFFARLREPQFLPKHYDEKGDLVAEP